MLYCTHYANRDYSHHYYSYQRTGECVSEAGDREVAGVEVPVEDKIRITVFVLYGFARIEAE